MQSIIDLIRSLPDAVVLSIQGLIVSWLVTVVRNVVPDLWGALGRWGRLLIVGAVAAVWELCLGLVSGADWGTVLPQTIEVFVAALGVRQIIRRAKAKLPGGTLQ